jgi:hypothetical protein
MASRGKKKTTMAKLTRESRLRERRLDKAARKDARKRASADHPGQPGDIWLSDPEDTFGDESGDGETGETSPFASPARDEAQS